MCTWVCLKYQTLCNAIYCCRCCDQGICRLVTHGERATDGKLCLSISAIGTAANNPRHRLDRLPQLLRPLTRRLPNAPRTYRFWRTLDPARESCRPTFVHTELLRSVRWSSNSGPAKIVQDQREGRVSPIPLVLGCAGIGSKGVLEM